MMKTSFYKYYENQLIRHDDRLCIQDFYSLITSIKQVNKSIKMNGKNILHYLVINKIFNYTCQSESRDD